MPVAAASLILSGPAQAALVAKLVTTNGVPQIQINGQPTVARIFYGGIGWEPIKVTAGDQKVAFDFTAVTSTPLVQMTIHFDPMPGNLTIDGIHVTDVTDNKDVTPVNAADPAKTWVGGTTSSASVVITPGAGRDGTTLMQVSLHAPASGIWTDTVLHTPNGLALAKGHQYHVEFMVKADGPQAVSVVFYRPQGDQEPQILGASNEPFVNQVKLAAKAGENIVTTPLRLPWAKDGETQDFSFADGVCDYILAANPNALIIPRININAPVWWIDAHPDDEMKWQGVRKGKTRAATIASPVYRKAAEDLLTSFLQHLEATYGEHMAGYHIAGGNSNEWFYEDSHSAALQGYAPADTTSWRQWLATQYTNDGALQQAWHQNDASLATAQVPTLEQRQKGSAGVFFDPGTERMVCDWNLYQQEEMAGFVRELAHLTRTLTQGNKLVLFFYGYLFEFAAVQMGPSSSGHFALREVLDCPDIDLLCAPISYYDRSTDGSGPSMTISESVALANKMWVMEDDTSTHMSLTYINPPGSKDRTHSMDETLQVVLRNGVQATLRNMGTWWMDLCRNGWFDDPTLWAAFAPFQPVADEMLKLKQPFQPEVAAVVDEKSMLLLAPHSFEVGGPIGAARSVLGRLGAPYGQYLQDDVAEGKVPNAKLYLFLTAWKMTAQERATLKAQTKGKTCLWGYGAGYWDGDTASLYAMHDLTGFQVKQITPKTLTVTPTDAGKKLGLVTAFGRPVPAKALTPLFAASDATPDEILATFDDGSTAVALRHTPDGVSIFCGSPTLSTELVRVAADAAGAHLFTHTDAAIYANGPFLGVHATQDGTVSIDTGRAGPVTDVMTGASLGPGPHIDLSLHTGQTRVLRY